MNFSLFAPYRGITGYDIVVREFMRRFHELGHNIASVEHKLWSNQQFQTEIDPIIEEYEANTQDPSFNPKFHLNFSLIDQAQLNLNTLNVVYTMFESDSICKHWVNHAKRLDLIVVPTEFNKQTFAKSGIPESKLFVCPVPLDLEKIQGERKPRAIYSYNGDDLSKYKHRFLHVSEYVTRKNFDGLVRAWCDETKDTDDACLLIKLNSNSGLKLDFIKKKLDKLLKRHKKCAPIFFYGSFLSTELMFDLYHWCTHYVTTSFGEGWGMSESICGVLGKRVVAPNSSAFTEYLNKDNAYIFATQTMSCTQTGPTAPYYAGSKWFAPIHFEVRKNLRKSIKEANEGEDQKGKLLSEKLKTLCNPTNAAKRLLDHIRKFKPTRSEPITVDLGKDSNNFNYLMVCKTLKTQCGIADYTEDLYKGMIAESNKDLYSSHIITKGDATNYQALLDSNSIHLVNLQLEYQFISEDRLTLLLEYCKNSNIVPVITMHTVNPRAYSYHEVLMKYKCPIIVSSQLMKDCLIRIGFGPEHPIKVIPMGIANYNIFQTKTPSSTDKKFTLGFFGFGYKHKGIDKVLQYMALHGQDKECRIFSTKPFNDRGDFDKIQNMWKKMNAKNIAWCDEFLPESQLVTELAKCDAIFLPYSEYGGLGVSAAIRTCLKAGAPIVAFENSFFKDIVHEEGLVKFVGSDPEEFDEWSGNLNKVIKDLESAKHTSRVAYEKHRNNFIKKYNWDEVAKMYLLHYQDLLNDK